MCPKKQQRTNSDGVMRIYENRCRCATTPDFLQQLAVSHLREAQSAEFHWRSCSEHTDPSQPIDDTSRNVGLSIYLGSIEMFVEKLPELGKRLVQLRLLRRWHARIRHHPIGNEVALEKAFRKTQRLRTCKK